MTNYMAIVARPECIRLLFDDDINDATGYDRPLSDLPRFTGWIHRFSCSDKYKIRPFMGGGFGIVVEKRGVQ